MLAARALLESERYLAPIGSYLHTKIGGRERPARELQPKSDVVGYETRPKSGLRTPPSTTSRGGPHSEHFGFAFSDEASVDQLDIHRTVVATDLPVLASNSFEFSTRRRSLVVVATSARAQVSSSACPCRRTIVQPIRGHAVEHRRQPNNLSRSRWPCPRRCLRAGARGRALPQMIGPTKSGSEPFGHHPPERIMKS
jgi:hypothetical protein